MRFLKSKKYFNLNPYNVEFWNALSHFLGMLMGIAGLIYLLMYNSNNAANSIGSIVIYGFSLVLLYSASTSYYVV